MFQHAHLAFCVQPAARWAPHSCQPRWAPLLLRAALRTLPTWQPPPSSQGSLLSRGLPGSKHLCFFWNQTPGTRFFLQQYFPQFPKCRGKPGALPSDRASLSQAPDGDKAPPPLNVLTYPWDPYTPQPPFGGPRVDKAGPGAVSQEAEQKWIQYCPGNNKGRAHAEIYLF